VSFSVCSVLESSLRFSEAHFRKSFFERFDKQRGARSLQRMQVPQKSPDRSKRALLRVKERY